ncbi:MAG TPA: YceK/YidQ family lipoprotein [Planctomycetota bacterium]|nr:YceK/YidQ family lipoprotein [Planctomycetota bacterium]
MIRRLPALALLLLLAGCGTIADMAGDGHLVDPHVPAPHIYGGVRVDAIAVDPGSLIAPLNYVFYLDFPFSAVLDTVLLPFSIPWTLAH